MSLAPVKRHRPAGLQARDVGIIGASLQNEAQVSYGPRQEKPPNLFERIEAVCKSPDYKDNGVPDTKLMTFRILTIIAEEFESAEDDANELFMRRCAAAGISE